MQEAQEETDLADQNETELRERRREEADFKGRLRLGALRHGQLELLHLLDERAHLLACDRHGSTTMQR